MKHLVFLIAVVQIVTTCCSGTGIKRNVSQFQTCLIKAGIQPSSLVERGPSTEYTDLNFQRQLRGRPIEPLAFLLVQSATEIRTAVNCGRSLGIRLVPKGGGHSYEKYSFGNKNSIVIDLQLMDSITVNQASRTVDVGPGNLIGPLIWRLYKEGGFLLSTGECPSVGISGIATGGGYGIFSSAYGLTSDNIVEVEVVTAAGKLLKVNSRKNSDLFWAIRGAGSQSFGIVSKFTFRIYKAPENVIFSQITYPVKKFPEIFSRYQDLLVRGLPSQIYAKLVVSQRTLNVEFSDSSGNASRLREIIGIFPSGSIQSDFQTFSYPDFLLRITEALHQQLVGEKLNRPSDLATIRRNTSVPTYTKNKSFFMNRKLIPLETFKLFKLLLEMPENGVVVLERFGGRINEIPADASAFVHRSALYNLLIRYQTVNPVPARLRQGDAWVRRVFDVTKILLQHTESYQNYVDGDLTDYLDRYYGSNLPHLIQIKHKYDKHNYFCGPQTIPTERK
jgi:FAD/FMN-containing dehydrogenase